MSKDELLKVLASVEDTLLDFTDAVKMASNVDVARVFFQNLLEEKLWHIYLHQ